MCVYIPLLTSGNLCTFRYAHIYALVSNFSIIVMVYRADKFPANMRRWANVVLLLGQRRRRWAISKPTLGQRLMFAWKAHFWEGWLEAYSD